MRVDGDSRRCGRAGFVLLGVIIGCTTPHATADESLAALSREFLEYLAEWDDADALMLTSPLFDGAVDTPPSTDREKAPAYEPTGASASE